MKLGAFKLSADLSEKLRTERVDVAPLAARNAKEALFFVFTAKLKAQSICEIESFRFSAE